MKKDVVIIGAGPAGIFTALEMIKKGTDKSIVIVEKGQPVEKRHCPKDKTKKCVNCKPYCHITTGFSGAGAYGCAPDLVFGRRERDCRSGGDYQKSPSGDPSGEVRKAYVQFYPLLYHPGSGSADAPSGKEEKRHQ